jgi:Cys-tRNA(Pro)/Cys-tRNA(Cys) deacylase
MKNNVTRYLDQRKIHFSVYQLPEKKLSAEETADILRVNLSKVYKTIVVKRAGNGKPLLGVVPGNRVVNLKKLAKVVGDKKVFLTSQREAEKITQLKAGGISPLALINRGFLVIIDQSALGLGDIHISGGQLGVNIRLPVDDLIALTKARVADISSNR